MFGRLGGGVGRLAAGFGWLAAGSGGGRRGSGGLAAGSGGWRWGLGGLAGVGEVWGGLGAGSGSGVSVGSRRFCGVSSALFGPDGTQLPEPDPVLPDVLVGAAFSGGWTAIPDDSTVDAGPPPSTAAQARSAAPAGTVAEARSAGRVRPAAQAPPGGRVRSERARPQPSPRVPAPRSGGSAGQRGGQPQVAAPLARRQQPPAPPGYAPAPPSQRRPRAAPTGTAQPAAAVAPAAGLQVRQVPQWPTHGSYYGSPGPQVEERRRRGVAGRVGCLLVLVFIGLAASRSLESLVDALLELVR